jgi:hypothetical protein
MTLCTLGAIGATRVISPVVTALRSRRIADDRTGSAFTNTLRGTAVTAPATVRLA